MKKTKLLAPLLAVATLGSTVAPIMTLTSCNKSGSLSQDDKDFLDDCNEICKASQNLVTCHKAVQACKNVGYDLVNYKLPDGFQFAYDSQHECFIIMNGDDVAYAPDNYTEPSNKLNLWLFVTEYNKNLGYSQYITDEYYTKTSLEVTTGIDTGENKSIKKVNYKHLSGSAQTVSINVYCDLLEISAQDTDNVTHYGSANNVYVYGSNTYTEAGKIAYLGISSTVKNVNLKYVDDKDSCSVDTIGFGSASTNVVQDDDAKVYYDIGVNEPEGLKPLYTFEVKNTATPNIATIQTSLADTDKQLFLFRLSDDLDFTEENLTNYYIEVAGQADKKRVVVLDLCGHNITDKDANEGYTVGKSILSRIVVKEYGSLILLDSKRTDSDSDACIDLWDDSITVLGSGTKGRANLVIDGITISYTAVEKNQGCIYIGTNDDTQQTVENDSHCYVFGGTLKALVAGTHGANAGATGIVPRSSGAFLQMIYGEINSDGACIAGNAHGDGTNIDIMSGIFTSNNDVCIYQPQESETNITGGTYYGKSCISTKAGKINITGGSFYATGTKPTEEIKSGSQDPDGSVLIVDGCGDEYYGSAPTVVVSNAYMVSRYNAILHGLVGQKWVETKPADAQVSFYEGGCYMFHEPDAGYYIGDEYDPSGEQTSSYFKVDKEGGNWIKVSV